MAKQGGRIGVAMNIVEKAPKLKAIKCNCKKCTNYSKGICILNRKTNRKTCKWFSENDYVLTEEERREVLKKSRRDTSYKQGWGEISTGTVDLSKFRRYR